MQRAEGLVSEEVFKYRTRVGRYSVKAAKESHNNAVIQELGVKSLEPDKKLEQDKDLWKTKNNWFKMEKGIKAFFINPLPQIKGIPTNGEDELKKVEAKTKKLWEEKVNDALQEYISNQAQKEAKGRDDTKLSLDVLVERQKALARAMENIAKEIDPSFGKAMTLPIPSS